MYEYSSHKSFEAADRYLENLFAAGLVDACEQPTIVRRGKRWVLMLSMGA
jgi:hypothetical protein